MVTQMERLRASSGCGKLGEYRQSGNGQKLTINNYSPYRLPFGSGTSSIRRVSSPWRLARELVSRGVTCPMRLCYGQRLHSLGNSASRGYPAPPLNVSARKSRGRGKHVRFCQREEIAIPNLPSISNRLPIISASMTEHRYRLASPLRR
jgi:hypothetical protein